MNYCELHLHTHYSALDGLNTPTEYMERAKELGMTHLAITDHGTLSGHRDFQRSAKEAGITPILGIEAYISSTDRFDRRANNKREDGTQTFNHIGLIALNENGQRNLNALNSEAWESGFYHKPRIDMELLEQYSDDIVVLSGCLNGLLCKSLEAGDYDRALKTASHLKSLFGERFFIEIQGHNPKEINEGLMRLSEDTGTLPVVTSDCHHARKEDLWVQEALLILSTKPKASSGFDLSKSQKMDYMERFNYLYPDRKMTFQHFNLHLNSALEHQAALEVQGIGPEPIENTNVVAGMVGDYSYYEGLDLLPVPDETVTDLDAELKRLVFEGLEERGLASEQEYIDRAHFELKVIADKGFANYFLILADVVSWAREQGIFIGPGRGSGVSSLVNYALHITNIDPIPYKLLFFRFLDPDRDDWPDIDVDFEVRRRYEVKEYVNRKYGHTANIMTFTYFRGKSAIKSAASAFKIPQGEVNRATSVLSDDAESSALEKYETAEITAEFRNKYPEVLELAKALDGRIKGTGMHAGGTIISKLPINDYVPMETRVDPSDEAKGRVPVIGINMNDAADIGLIKYDFLGLNNLTVILEAIEDIYRRTGERIDPYDIPLDDADVYDMLSKGNTRAVFQCEGGPYTKMLVKMGGVDNFEDLISSNALVRPGAANSSIGENYIKGKNYGEYEYVHKDAEYFTRETYGQCLFQDTPVLTKAGVKKIVNISIGDTVYGQTGPGVVTNKMYTGHKKVYRVKLSNGRTILSSGDHRFLTDKGYVTADSLDGKIVAVPRYSMQTGSVDDPMAAWLLGILIAEGSLVGSPYIANNDEEIIHRFANLVDSRFDCDSVRYFNTRCNYIRAVSKVSGGHRNHYRNPVAQWLRDICLFEKTGGNKFVPEWVWSLDDYSKAAFVGAWVSGDGTVTRDTVKVRTAYEHMATSLHDILTSLGIFSSVRSDASGFTVFILDNVKYNDIIKPHVYGDKGCVAVDAVSRMGWAPNVVRGDRAKTGRTTRSYGPAKGLALSTSPNYISRRVADNYGFKSDFNYVKAEVEETDEYLPMFDIEVEGTHSFTTSGVIVHNCLFQEQQMLLCTEVAGLSMKDANAVRKAIGKKKADQLAIWEPAFIEGATKKIGERKAQMLWDDLEKSAEYAFNRAHSVGYSMISYWTAWFKLNYPVEYMTAVLNNLSGSDVKTKALFYLMEAKRMGVKVKLPHVNASDVDSVVEDGSIRMGLASIKYISGKVGNKIIDNGPYESFEHLSSVAKTKGSGINSRAIESLNKVGAAAFPDNPRTGDERANFYEYLNIPAFESKDLPAYVKLQFRDVAEYSENDTFVVCAMVYNIKVGTGWALVEYVDESGSSASFASQSIPMEKGKMYVMLVSNNRIARYITTDEILNGEGGALGKFLEKDRFELEDGQYRCISFNSRDIRNGPNRGKKMATAIFTDADKNLTSAMVFTNMMDKATMPCVTASKVRVEFAETKDGALYVKEIE